MKKISILLSLMMIFLVACGQDANNTEVNNETQTQEESTTTETATEETADTETTDDESVEESIVVKSYNPSGEVEEVEVPTNPEKIVVLDMAALDIIESLGLGDRVVGAAQTQIDYLQDIVNSENVVDGGTLKNPNLEAIMSVQPDLIFIGGRLADFQDQLSQIAPVISMRVDQEKGVFESTRENAQIIGSIFGLESDVDDKVAAYEERINAINEYGTGKTAIVGLVTNGGFNVLGSDGRMSLISNEMGFENLGDSSDLGETASHGNEASFEYIVEQDPDYIFVLDRDSAIAAEGAQLASEIMDNELIHKTSAHQNGNLVVVEHSSIWYTAEGGITALDIMLSDIENGINQ